MDELQREVVAAVLFERARLGSVTGKTLDRAVALGVMRRIDWNRWAWTAAGAEQAGKAGA